MRFANEQRQPGEGKQERRGKVEGEGESKINNNMSGQQYIRLVWNGLGVPPTKLGTSKFAPKV